MCFGEPEPLQGQNWADARRLSPRWNHSHWRHLSLIMYTLGIAGQAGLGGRFLRLRTPLPSFPSPLHQGTRGSKRICWNQVSATKAFSIVKLLPQKSKRKMVRVVTKIEGDERAR